MMWLLDISSVEDNIKTPKKTSFVFLLIFETESPISDWSPMYHAAEDDFELVILLPSPPKYQDYRCVSLCPVYVVLRTEPRALHIQLYQPSCILSPTEGDWNQNHIFPKAGMK